MMIFGVLGGLAAVVPNASTNAASSSGLITAKRMSGNSLSTAYSATASGERSVSTLKATTAAPSPSATAASWVLGSCCRQLLHHVANVSTSTGVPMQSASVNACPSTSTISSVCHAGSSATAVDAEVPDESDGLHGSAPGDVDESGGAVAVAVASVDDGAPTASAATTATVISDGMVLLP